MLNPPTLEPQPVKSKKHKSSHRSQESNNRKIFDKNDNPSQTYLSSNSSYSGAKRLELIMKKVAQRSKISSKTIILNNLLIEILSAL